MEKDKVLLRKDAAGVYREIGRVALRQGKQLTLLLPDGSTTTHLLVTGREMTPDRGSFHHVLRVATHEIERALFESPERIFKQLLYEASKPLSAKELKDRLKDLPQALVDSAWTTAKPRLDADNQVDRLGSDGSRYRLRRDVAMDLLDLLPPATAAPPPPEPRRPDLIAGAAEDSLPGNAPDLSAVDTPAIATGTGPEGDALLVRLATMGPELDLRGVADVARRPLEVGQRVARLKATGQQELVGGPPARAPPAARSHGGPAQERPPG